MVQELRGALPSVQKLLLLRTPYAAQQLTADADWQGAIARWEKEAAPLRGIEVVAHAEEKLQAQFLVRHLATAEAQRDLHLVTGTEEADESPAPDGDYSLAA